MAHEGHGISRRHLWIMLACCLIPVAGLGVVWLLGVSLGVLWILALLLVCLVGHFFLMRGMGHSATHAETFSGQTGGKEFDR